MPARRSIVEPLEYRKLLSAVATQDRPVTLSDGDGSNITVRVAGAGSATADIAGGALTLAVSGTSKATSLTIDVAGGGDGRAILQSLTATSALGSLAAPAVDLKGAIRFKSIESLTVRTITGANVHSSWIGSLSTQRVTRSLIASDRIGSIDVKADLESSRIGVSPADDTQVALSSLNVRGMIHSSTVFALGDIGSVTARRMIGANVTAGVRFSESSTASQLVQPLPDERSGAKLYDFVGKYNISRLKVTGFADGRIAFAHSIVGAYKINNATLNGVDGIDVGSNEFGISAYYVGRIKRTFDAAHASLNAQEHPFADFVARQISEPLVFDSSTGTYGGSTLYLGGANAASGTTIVTSANWLTLWNDLPKEGAQIGTIENAGAAHTVFLSYDGKYELRNSKSRAVQSSTRLGSLIATALGSAAGNSIKIENVSGNSTIDLRTTSVGPVIHLTTAKLGSTFYQGMGAHGGLTIGGQSGSGSSSNFKSFSVPEFTTLSRQIKSAGATVQVYTQKMLIVSADTFSVGKLIGVEEVGSLDLTQSFNFASGDATESNFGNLLASAAVGHVGSRRLPARFVNNANSVTIYGLPNGGTAVISNLGQPALNAAGNVAWMPRANDVKQSLIDAGIGLA